MSGLVELAREGKLFWLTLARPERANAFGIDMVRDFGEALAEVKSSGGRALVISGAGEYFSGGGDVREMAQAPDLPAYLSELVGAMHACMLQLVASPLVTIAAVNGVAAGAGLGIALSTDFVVASDRARFVGAYAAIGLTPDCGVSYFLPRMIGPRRAADVCVAGRSVTAPLALEWGMVNELVEHEQLAVSVRSRVEALAAAPPHALSATKRLLGGPLDEFEQHLEREASAIVQAAAHHDTAERVAAFARRHAR